MKIADLAALVFPLAATVAAAGDGAERIGVGEARRGSLSSDDVAHAGRQPSRRFTFVPEGDGPVTISLDSFDFDALLCVATPDGPTIADDDNGGIATNARLVFEAKRGAVVDVVVRAVSDAAGGEFEVRIERGALPAPTGVARSDAAIAFRVEAAERALHRRDWRSAATHRLEEGNEQYQQSRFDRAKRAYESALKLDRHLGDRAGEAKAIANLGVVELCLGDYARAREHLEQHLAFTRASGDQAGEAKACGNLGSVYFAIGDVARAREFKTQALALAREAGDRDEESAALGGLAVMLASLGNGRRALPLFEKRLEWTRASRNRASEARTLGNLGALHQARGENGLARDYLEQQLTVARELGDRINEMLALDNLGVLLASLGNPHTARTSCAQSLAIARELGDRRSETAAFGHLGQLYLDLSDFRRARPILEAHLRRSRERGDRPAEVVALGNLGALRQSLGEVDEARRTFARQLMLAREIGDRIREAAALGRLGLLHQECGEIARARIYHERQLSLARRIGRRESEADALRQLGRDHLMLGDAVAARTRLAQGLALAREIGDSSREAASLRGFAELLESTGNIAGSRVAAEAATARFIAIGAEAELLHSLWIVARGALAQHDDVAVESALQQAESLLQRPWTCASEVADSPSPRSRYAAWEWVSQDLTALRAEQAGAASSERGRAIEFGFQAAARFKGHALLEGIVEHKQGGRSAEAIRLRRLQRETVATRDAVLREVSQAIQDEKPAAYVESLRANARGYLERSDAYARELRDRFPREEALDAPPALDSTTVRRAVLDARTALVEFASGGKRLYAYALGVDRLELLDLGERDAIGIAADAFVAALAQPQAGPESVSALVSRSRALYDILLSKPLQALGDGIERLVIVPTPALAGLPFEALACRSRGEPDAVRSFADVEFVIDRYEVCYGPSSLVLVELASAPARRGPEGSLVLADPAYETPSSRGAGSLLAARSGLARLEGTREEALTLARLRLEQAGDERRLGPALDALASRRHGALRSTSVDLFFGDEASPRVLVGDLRRYSTLHFAAHASVDRENPKRTALLLSSGGNVETLTVDQVLELDLDADLVVLSACQTAQGPVRRGEGVQSMARAFLYAGARRVVASLWEVSDLAAAQTMEAFYERVIAGHESPPSALRQAKLALRRGEELGSLTAARGPVGTVKKPDVLPAGHPSRWAAFISIGLP